MSDPQVRSLFERVDVVADDYLDRTFPGTESSILTLHTGDGSRFTRRNDGPVRGEPEDPMSNAEIEAKFEVMAGPELGAGRQNVVDTINHLDALEDINDLTLLWASREA